MVYLYLYLIYLIKYIIKNTYSYFIKYFLKWTPTIFLRKIELGVLFFENILANVLFFHFDLNFI